MTELSKSLWNCARVLNSFCIVEATSASDNGVDGKALLIIVVYVPQPDLPNRLDDNDHPPRHTVTNSPRTRVNMQLISFVCWLTSYIDLWISGGSFHNVSIHATNLLVSSGSFQDVSFHTNNILVSGGTWVQSHSDGKHSPFFSILGLDSSLLTHISPCFFNRAS
jgi:hypothetical protein